jgi:hypothetical protein
VNDPPRGGCGTAGMNSGSWDVTNCEYNPETANKHNKIIIDLEQDNTVSIISVIKFGYSIMLPRNFPGILSILKSKNRD